MNINVPITVVIFFALVGGMMSCSPKSTPPAVVVGPQAERVDAYLTRLVPFGFWGGVLLAVDGEVMLHKGYGWANKDNGGRNTRDTVFGLQSITKQFTAAGIMFLVQEGKLSVDDVIGEYLGEVPDDKRDITIHQLLTHTSGLISGTEIYIADNDREGVLKTTLEAPLLHEPGGERSYSNLGYGVLAAVAEKITGKSFPIFMRESIFLPAGLEATGYREPDWDRGQVAHWYASGNDNGSPLNRAFPDWNHMGSGGVLSTLGDMYRWHEVLTGESILSAKTKERMYTTEKDDYAYGWRVEETDRGQLVRHTGGHSDGMAGEFRRYMDAGITLIIFCNRDGESMLFADRVVDHVESLVFGESFPLPPLVDSASTIELDSYAGFYTSPSGDSLVILATENMLEVRAFGQAMVAAAFDLDEPTKFAKANLQAQRALNAMAEGDTVSLRTILTNPSSTNRVPRWVGERVAQGAQNFGEFQGFSVLGTTPDWVSGFGTMMTFVQAEFESGFILFRFHWTDDGVMALGGSGIQGPVSIKFLPVKGGSFAGYHLATGASTEFEIESVSEAEGFRVTFGHGSRAIVLTR